MLRRILGPNKDKVTGKWRELHNEELSDLYSSPHIARVIKSRIMRWAVHVACMRERRGVYRISVGKLEGDDLEDPGVDGRKMLRGIFSEWVVGARIELIWLMIGTCGGRL